RARYHDGATLILGNPNGMHGRIGICAVLDWNIDVKDLGSARAIGWHCDYQIGGPACQGARSGKGEGCPGTCWALHEDAATGDGQKSGGVNCFGCGDAGPQRIDRCGSHSAGEGGGVVYVVVERPTADIVFSGIACKRHDVATAVNRRPVVSKGIWCG